MKGFRISFYLLFIDFRSAYGSIDRERVYKAMNELNIPEKLILLVKMIMSDMQSHIKIQSKYLAPFIIHKNVQQGDALECLLLFNITLENTIRKSGLQTRGTIFYKPVQLMAYAYDIDVIGRSLASMKEAFQLLEEASKDVGLVNEGKTKYLVAANTQNYSKPHTI
jgi:hypothetical protein